MAGCRLECDGCGLDVRKLKTFSLNPAEDLKTVIRDLGWQVVKTDKWYGEHYCPKCQKERGND